MKDLKMNKMKQSRMMNAKINALSNHQGIKGPKKSDPYFKPKKKK